MPYYMPSMDSTNAAPQSTQNILSGATQGSIPHCMSVDLEPLATKNFNNYTFHFMVEAACCLVKVERPIKPHSAVAMVSFPEHDKSYHQITHLSPHNNQPHHPLESTWNCIILRQQWQAMQF